MGKDHLLLGLIASFLLRNCSLGGVDDDLGYLAQPFLKY